MNEGRGLRSTEASAIFFNFGSAKILKFAEVLAEINFGFLKIKLMLKN